MNTVRGDDLSADLMAVLHAWGIPKRASSIDIHISRGPVVIRCTFQPEAEDGRLKLAGEGLAMVTKRFNLVEADTQAAD